MRATTSAERIARQTERYLSLGYSPERAAAEARHDEEVSAPYMPVFTTASPAAVQTVETKKKETLMKEMDFMETAGALAAAKGIRISEAMSQVARANPELHRAYLAKCAAMAPRIAARKRELGIR